jgi:hypothetical protein
MDAAKWIQDLNFLEKKLPESHIRLFHDLKQNEFYGRLEDLKSQVELLSDEAILFYLMNLITSVNDAHTTICYYDWTFNLIPIQTFLCDDGLVILGAHERVKHLIGKTVLAINEFKVQEIIGDLSAFIPHENESWLKEKIPEYIVNADLLKFIGRAVSEDSVIISYLDQGIEKNEKLFTVRSNYIANIRMAWYFDKPGFELPAAWRFRQKKYWYQYYNKEKAGYFQYNQCLETPFESFSIFSDRFFQFLSQHELRALIFDVRFNQGGDSDLFSNYFSPKLESFVNSHQLKLVTITGRRTFSSGLWVAIEMKKKYNCLLIGEPPGNKPDHYGDQGQFVLPHSKLRINYSKRYWELTGDHKDSLVPDIYMPVLSSDILAGRDRFLEQAFQSIDGFKPIKKQEPSL